MALELALNSKCALSAPLLCRNDGHSRESSARARGFFHLAGPLACVPAWLCWWREIDKQPDLRERQESSLASGRPREPWRHATASFRCPCRTPRAPPGLLSNKASTRFPSILPLIRCCMPCPVNFFAVSGAFNVLLSAFLPLHAGVPCIHLM